MATVILDQQLAQSLIAERRRLGQDRYDEVWEGVYRMAPAPRTLHSKFVSQLWGFFQSKIELSRQGQVLIGVNVSDRVKGWDKNYRIPDLSVMLHGGKSVDHDTFWLGGPDFVVEVCSPDEDPHEKIEFYGAIGVREMLIINRDPWKLELLRRSGDGLKLAVQATPGSGEIASEVIPFRFGLRSGAERPELIVTHSQSAEQRVI
jgi:hypothetical protein